MGAQEGVELQLDPVLTPTQNRISDELQAETSLPKEMN
jgi:hypothetical protein